MNLKNTSNTAQYDLTLLIAVYNEASGIPHLKKHLVQILSTLDASVEIIFVDDGSTDESLELLKKYVSTICDTQIIALPENIGDHAAVRMTLPQCRGLATVILGADMQEPPDVISELYKQYKNGADVVWAERHQSVMSVKTRIFSWFFAAIVRFGVSKNYPKTGYGIVLFGPRVKQKILLLNDVRTLMFVSVLSIGNTQKTVPYEVVQRQYGTSKYTLRKKYYLLRDTIVSCWRVRMWYQ